MESITTGDNETYPRGHHSEERKRLVSDISSGGSDVPSSRVAYNAFRGWGGRGPIHNYSSLEDISPRRRNLSDKNSFFSRKSFKDLGCSDYMIDSLRALNFLRPSHIQVYQIYLFIIRNNQYSYKQFLEIIVMVYHSNLPFS